ncbi:purine permease [Clostridioides mangenotii]|uniref:nucleobase:cation symporter-2 family protein n=1 Tax=Metaclostridioides mangenotii TaxID=1540 RepID=UPI002149AD77|nr:nucleobase:cation symporter-2 family protein [Clostridioides mangenotii]MCR1955167.1 purine permease [Clostridioides mangenotii]
MSQNNSPKIAPVDEKMSFKSAWVFSLQHVLAMCAGAVAVPMMIGSAAGLDQTSIVFLINACLFMAGIGTLIQSVGIGNIIGARIPVIEGTSFAAVAGMTAIATSYNDPNLAIQNVFGAVIVAGIFCIVLAPVFEKLIRFFPSVVTGTVVMVIGISLFPVGIKWITNNKIEAVDPKTFALSMAVLAITLLSFKLLKGTWNSAAIIVGIVLGTVLAMAVGMADFSSVADAGWFTINTPFKFGLPQFDVSAILSLCLIMLVLMTESVGNMIAIHEMVDKEVTGKNIKRALFGDGISTALSGIFNSFPITPFGQNTGIVGLTGIKSRYVAVYAGAMLLLFGFVPKIAAIVAAIPKPVLGGVAFAMFGMVMVGGVRTLSKVQFNGTMNGVIVAASVGLSVIPIVNADFYNNFPAWVQTIFHSGITTGSLAAVLLNIFFNEIGSKKKATQEQAQ